MATVIPSETRKDASKGEIRLLSALRSLPEDYIVYQLKSLDKDYPSFMLIEPLLGVVIIDDHNEQSIGSLLESSSSEKLNNYLAMIKGNFLNTPSLMHEERLGFPFGVLVVLSNLSFPQVQERVPELQSRYSNYCLREELLNLTETHEALPNLIERFRSCQVQPENFIALDFSQINLIRAIVDPAIFFSRQNFYLGTRQQEVLKTITQGSGHRIVSGVAGSGKTLVLAAYVRSLLRENPNRRVLCLCYNNGPVRFLRYMLRDDPSFPEGQSQNLEIITFNQWASGLTRDVKSDFFDHRITNIHNVQDHHFRRADNPQLANEMFNAFKGFIERFENYLMNTSNEPNQDNGWRALKYLIDHPDMNDSLLYDAILIDEGHTFQPHWFPCALLSLRNGIVGKLLIVRDQAQGIFKHHQPKGLGSITWKELGVMAIGRSAYLRENYRNTRQIVNAAWSVIEAQVSKGGATTNAGDDYASSIPQERPECSRDGDKPTIKKVKVAHANPKCYDYQIQCALDIVKNLLSKGADSRDIAILYREGKRGLLEKLVDSLSAQGLGGGYWVNRTKETQLAYDPQTPGVKIWTTASALGSEFESVIIIWLDQFNGCYSGQDPDESRRQQRELYVAMTRPRNNLYLIGSEDCEVIKHFCKSNRGLFQVSEYRVTGSSS